MFYILSKLLQFLLRPITWILIFIIVAFFSKSVKRKKQLMLLSFALLFLFSNNWIYATVSKWWCSEQTNIETMTEQYDIAIVLGGYSSSALDINDRLHLTEASTRLTTTLELYKRGIVDKILITSGVLGVTVTRPSEAALSTDFLQLMGVAEEDIIIETKSRNTYENAFYTAEIIEKNYPNAKCLMITSAYHIRRANACFKKTNINFDTFATELSERSNKRELFDYVLPETKTLYYWDRLIKEWVGMIMYKAKGYI